MYRLLIPVILFASNTLAQPLHKEVNPFIGTGGHGHTYPGATRPFAMVQLSPDTRIDGSWDGCSGYHYSDSIIYGFSHTHLSGTGCSDYGDIAYMPVLLDQLPPVPISLNAASSFKHQSEKAHAGYYAVTLDNGVNVELTTTDRVGMQRYTVARKGLLVVVLDMKHRDELIEGSIKPKENNCIQGYRRSKAWAKDQYVFYHTQFNQKPKQIFINRGKKGDEKMVAIFDAQPDKPLLIKTALSSVSAAGAEKNMNKELPHWDFEQVRQEAENSWDKQLSKITITPRNAEDSKIFYTALYHTMLQPNVLNDVDGQYRGRDNKIHTAVDYNHYTVFSLWDTYRTAHPLYTLIEPERTTDFIKTFLAQYQQSGRLPMWELWGNETDCMIGYHAVSVIADAMAKGYKNYDTNLAWQACMAASQQKIYGIDKFHQKGYLEVEDEHESVSKTLEYAYNDWCIAQIAKMRGDLQNVERYSKYSQGGWHVIDKATFFARPRSNGGWLEPFDPYQVNNNYTEANAWQYSFASSFNEHFSYSLIDKLFAADTKTTGREQADITGLIGQYAHGNEPSHHIAWLLEGAANVNTVHRILNDFYKNTPDGLIGNEDCGQMSAWYVMSALGIYPLHPGDGKYKMGWPLFEKATIKGPKGNIEILRPEPKFGTNEVVQFTNDKGDKYAEMLLPHSTLVEAKLLTAKGASMSKASLLPKRNSRSAPIISSTKGLVFDDTASITITANGDDPSKSIYYNIGEGWQPYTKPIIINKSITVNALHITKLEVGNDTTYSTASYYKRPNDYEISIQSKAHVQYTAGGNEALLDGLHGDTDWRKGRWQGYQGQDFEAIVDLKKIANIKKVAATFLQDQRAWIFYPKEVLYYSSEDGKQWRIFGKHVFAFAQQEEVSIKKALVAKSAKARYIKVIAKNYGILPSWHQGAGGNAYIFVDEITVE